MHLVAINIANCPQTLIQARSLNKWVVVDFSSCCDVWDLVRRLILCGRARGMVCSLFYIQFCTFMIRTFTDQPDWFAGNWPRRRGDWGEHWNETGSSTKQGGWHVWPDKRKVPQPLASIYTVYSSWEEVLRHLWFAFPTDWDYKFQKGFSLLLRFYLIVTECLLFLSGPWKRVCLTNIGIVTQCLGPPPSKINNQYLTNVVLKINAKVLHTVISDRGYMDFFGLLCHCETKYVANIGMIVLSLVGCYMGAWWFRSQAILETETSPNSYRSYHNSGSFESLNIY